MSCSKHNVGSCLVCDTNYAVSDRLCQRGSTYQSHEMCWNQYLVPLPWWTKLSSGQTMRSSTSSKPDDVGQAPAPKKSLLNNHSDNRLCTNNIN